MIGLTAGRRRGARGLIVEGASGLPFRGEDAGALVIEGGRPRVLRASDDILEECIACGGSVTGEHGIGVEKINFMRRLFNDDDLTAMTHLRDAFNPGGRLSPGKMLPTAGACGMEQTHPGRRAAL